MIFLGTVSGEVRFPEVQIYRRSFSFIPSFPRRSEHPMTDMEYLARMRAIERPDSSETYTRLRALGRA